MLKKLQKTICAFSVICSFIFATFGLRVSAAEEVSSVVIFQLQVRSVDSSSSELVVLFNSGSQSQQITNWCVEYASASNENFRSKGCVDPPADTEIWLDTGGFASFSTAEYELENPNFTADFLLSHGLSNSSGHIRLVDAEKTEIDRIGWGEALYPEGSAAHAPESGLVLARISGNEVLDSNDNMTDFVAVEPPNSITSGVYEQEKLIDLCSNIDGIQIHIPEGYLYDEQEECFLDFCPNIEGLQLGAPEGMILSGGECINEPVDLCINIEGVQLELPDRHAIDEGNCMLDVCSNITGFQAEIPTHHLLDEQDVCIEDLCETIDGLQTILPEGYEAIEQYQCTPIEQPKDIVPEHAAVIITEVYANAPSYDAGKEFIELFNPLARAVNLHDYVLSFSDEPDEHFVFNDVVLQPLEYRAFSDLETGLTLPNTVGRALRLTTAADTLASESDAYQNSPDDMSWSLIDENWLYTTILTPNARNETLVAENEDAQEVIDDVEIQYEPCGDGRYRSPVTNRCRAIETSTSSYVPCGANEYRSPETNRCRKVAASTSTLVPCDTDEFRNPSTNRCNKLTTASAQYAPCAPGQEPVSYTHLTLPTILRVHLSAAALSF